MLLHSLQLHVLGKSVLEAAKSCVKGDVVGALACHRDFWGPRSRQLQLTSTA